MGGGVVLPDGHVQRIDRQPPHGLQHAVAVDNDIAFGADQSHLGVVQGLLRVQHIDFGALAHLQFGPHAFQRGLGGIDLGLVGQQLCPRRLQLRPCRSGIGLRLLARLLNVFQQRLPVFLLLPDLRAHVTSLVDR